ncbi:MAG: ATP-dependent DNA helicase RecQ [Vicinamibacterales bacterium]
MSQTVEARLARTLREVFQLERLRPGQEAVIRSVLAGRHTIAIMPTGAGKSLCYQLPGLLLPGMTVVVSPLIALMKDQHDKLRRLGVPVAQVNSALPAAETAEARAAIASGQSAFTFVTPEQLGTPAFEQSIRGKRIDLLVVDEAHCISQWGHDFRPSCLEITGTLERLGRPPVLALTATAPDSVLADITRVLSLERPAVLNTGLYRPNLNLAVRQVSGDEDKLRQIVDLVHGIDGPAIVYAATIPHVELVHRVLQQEGRSAVRYHGRLPSRERREAQDAFMSGAAQVVVATNAFGLGIDKPDVRLVAHYDLTPSLEAYYQEAGRAGRDGEAASCALLFQRSDRSIQAFLMAGRYPPGEHFARVWHALESLDSRSGRVSFGDVQHAVPDMTRNALRVVLAALKASGLITDRRTRGLRAAPHATAAAVGEIQSSYERRADRDRELLDQMIVYGQTARCRWKVILDYFGEAQEWERCGSCDSCLGTAERAVAR